MLFNQNQNQIKYVFGNYQQQCTYIHRNINQWCTLYIQHSIFKMWGRVFIQTPQCPPNTNIQNMWVGGQNNSAPPPPDLRKE